MEVSASSVAIEADLDAGESITIAAGGGLSMQIAVASRTTQVDLSLPFVMVRTSESWDRVAVEALE